MEVTAAEKTNKSKWRINEQIKDDQRTYFPDFPKFVDVFFYNHSNLR